MKKIAIAVTLLSVLAALIVHQRFRIVLTQFGDGSPPPLLDAQDEGADVTWHDDYYIVQALDAKTFAIGEPRYLQQNFNYLIIGTERALLFDAGSGYRDIRPVVEALTDKPVTFLPSHFHFDHVGNRVEFERVAVIDLPHLRDRAPNNELQLTWEEHLGSLEGYDPPTLKIDEWLEAGSLLELGDRSLRVIFSPGHTDDSVSLLDAARGYLFSGDFMYPGPLFAFLPNSNMGDYLQ
ncbi:MAG: MBL fold metallo-hydrolase, partial [Myxococcales bacterium]|nr:MBL fold metallo-hydrolase [Myxococcales bacterium]